MADGGGDDGAKTIRRQRARRDNDDLRFAKVPNEIILEAGVSPPTLRLIAYRQTKVGDFVLHPTDVKKQLGMSKGAFYKAVGEMARAELNERTQNLGAPRRKRVTEKFHMRVPGPDDSGYSWVWMKLIRGLPPAALAVYMLLLAHWPKRKLYAREVREHFGWSKPTVQKWMTYLIYHGLAGELPQRNHGDFAGSVYLPAELSADEIARWSLRDGEPTRPIAERRSAETRNPETVSGPRLADADSAEPHFGATYKEPSSLTKDFPSTSNLHSTLRVEGPAGGGDDGRDVSGGVTTWLEELEALAPQRFELWSPPMNDHEALEACSEELDDAQLRADLWKVTDARIGRALISEVGLDGYRRVVVGCADIAYVSFSAAHVYLLELVAARIGSDRRRSLNSWRWLLQTLLDRVREPGDIHEPADDEDEPEIPF